MGLCGISCHLLVEWMDSSEWDGAAVAILFLSNGWKVENGIAQHQVAIFFSNGWIAENEIVRLQLPTCEWMDSRE